MLPRSKITDDTDEESDMRLLILTTALLALAACTTVPEQIQGEFAPVSPDRAEPGVIGAEVRWGGVILGSRYVDDKTCFEVLSRELDKYLRPAQEDYSNGRFIACKPGFQDPLVFSKGREITATGAIRNITVRKVEDFNYRYPVIDVDTLVLWEKRRQVTVYRNYGGPWMYRYPWGYPYWGYRGWGGPSWGRAEQRSLLPDPSIVEQDGNAAPIVYPEPDTQQ